MLDKFLCVSMSKAKSFAELKPLVENANANLTIFGRRKFCVKGKWGSMDIDALVRKVNVLVTKNYEFSEEERAHGKFIVSKINEFYATTDDQAGETNKKEKQRNVFTRTLCKIRDILPPKIKFYWEQHENEIFEYYTKTQYEKVFGHSPSHDHKWMRTDCPDRWRKI
jgi:hypothetical protein